MIPKTVFLFLVSFILPFFMSAQNKVGYVNTPKLLESMPEVKTANSRIDSVIKSYHDQIIELYEEYQKQMKYAELNKDTILRKRLQEAAPRLKAFEDDARQDMAKKKEEYLGPILKKGIRSH